mgnify:CR=1 FL=1
MGWYVPRVIKNRGRGLPPALTRVAAGAAHPYRGRVGGSTGALWGTFFGRSRKPPFLGPPSAWLWRAAETKRVPDSL